MTVTGSDPLLRPEYGDLVRSENTPMPSAPSERSSGGFAAGGRRCIAIELARV